MIWFDLSRWSRKLGYTCIFALGLMFVQSGILGNDKFTFFFFFMMGLCSQIHFFTHFFVFGLRGFPVWLKYVPGISFRTDNKPFKVSLSLSLSLCTFSVCVNLSTIKTKGLLMEIERMKAYFVH